MTIPNGGSNFGSGYGNVEPFFKNTTGNVILARCTVANLPTGLDGYAIGCTIQAADTGNMYQNTGTATSATWTLLEDAGGTFTLPTSATDATTTTTTSFSLTQNAITSGIGLSQALNGLTTGQGHLISHTTAVIADGGSLLRVTSSSVDTGGATNGTVFDFKSTGQLAGTVGRLDVILTTGTAMSIIGTGVMTTTGNLLTLTANSATTSNGLLQVSGTGMTSGVISLLTGGGANMLTAGIVQSVAMGAATVGAGQKIVTTGVYTDTAAAVHWIVASSATSGNILAITTTSSRAFNVGQALATPAFQVDASTASQIAGLKVTGAATGGTVAVASIDSGSNASLTVDGKGSGTVGIGNTSTGEVSLSRGARKSLIVGGTVTTLNAQNVTPTAAQLLGGQIKHTTQTAGGTFTLDTGTNISTAVTGVAVGDTFTCLYINNGNQTGTITTAASGTTLFGTAAVTTGKTALLTFSNTGSNTWDVYITTSA